MTPLLEARDVIKTYGGRQALHLKSLLIAAGAAIILKGPNGSGKSTLLRLLAFLEKPDSGRIIFSGGSEPRKHITLLLQETWLLNTSVFNNVTLGLRLRKSATNLKSAYINAMSATGFNEPMAYARRRPQELSGGEKQRVALAARLALNPRILLLDEPTTFIDAQSAALIIDVLSRLNGTGMTIVCATHDPCLLNAINGSEFTLP